MSRSAWLVPTLALLAACRGDTPLSTRDPRRLLQTGAMDLALGSFPEALPAVQAEGAESLLRHRPTHQVRAVDQQEAILHPGRLAFGLMDEHIR